MPEYRETLCRKRFPKDEVEMGETRKPSRRSERNPHEVFEFNGEPVQWQLTDEEGEL
jgi:hypothetical protein